MIDAEDIKELIDTSDRLVASVSTGFHRYLSSEIDWNGRLICIKGASGTGKTTLMRQRLKESFGDFLVDGTWHFEVGGAGKGFDQVKDIPTAYVVNDDTEIGLGNKIPLWLFGFRY